MFFTIIIIVIFYFLSIYFSLCLNLSVLSYLPLCVASPSGINKGLFYLILLWNIVYVLYRQQSQGNEQQVAPLLVDKRIISVFTVSCTNATSTHLVHTLRQPPPFLCVRLPAPSALRSTEILRSAQTHCSGWGGSRPCRRTHL